MYVDCRMDSHSGGAGTPPSLPTWTGTDPGPPGQQAQNVWNFVRSPIFDVTQCPAQIGEI